MTEQYTLPSIKEAFISRWGDEGLLIEVDYSQLELIALAELSGDTNLQAALKSSDFHRLNAAAWLNKTPSAVTKEERREAKSMTFQLTYGAGYKKMAATLKIAENVCKEFINRFYKLYPKVKAYQDKNIWMVDRLAFNFGDKLPTGEPIKRSVVASITGRKYLFKQTIYDNRQSPYHKHRETFKPTEIKNYFVQGFATGDIVPEMLGRIVKALYKEGIIEYVKPINTVHDSVLFDVQKAHALQACTVIRNTMQDVQSAMLDRFDIKLTMPYNVEIKIGPSWGEMIVVED